jgi:hypothetical protein
LKWDARDSLPEQAIATGSATNTVVHVNFSSPGNFAQKCKIRLAVSPWAKLPVRGRDKDELDQIVSKLREEISKCL